MSARKLCFRPIINIIVIISTSSSAFFLLSVSPLSLSAALSLVLLLFANCIVLVCVSVRGRCIFVNLLAYHSTYLGMGIIIGQMKPFKCEIWNLWWLYERTRMAKQEKKLLSYIMNRGNVTFIVLPILFKSSNERHCHPFIRYACAHVHNAASDWEWMIFWVTKKKMMNLIEKKASNTIRKVDRDMFDVPFNARYTQLVFAGNLWALLVPCSRRALDRRRKRKPAASRVCEKEKFKPNFVT